MVLLVVLVTDPALRWIFGFGPMARADWLVTLAASLAGIAWFEFVKLRHAPGRESDR